MTETRALYLKHVFAQIPRLLSWQNREEFSRTYGCFDRTYWAWKFVDFPGARFQEGVYALAKLFCDSSAENPLANNPLVLDSARAGMNFWQSIQHGDGSFDEAYPHEHSLAATAFTSFYLGEAFLLSREHLSANEQTELRATFTRAGDWLCRSDERHGILSNHRAAAAVALQVIYQICGDTKYQARSRFFLESIYDHQSAEGWYEEYGGADPGYQTVATFYLARLWQHTRDQVLLDSLRRSLAFLKFFIHPNATLGGEYGSRNTEFYFPAGVEMLVPAVADAAAIARFMRRAVTEQSAAGLAAMDVYNFLPMLNNYLFAAENAASLENRTERLPCESEIEAHFPEAGLLVKSNPAYYCVVGVSKGGVVKAYDRSTHKRFVSDCGYWARLGNGRVASSQNLNRPGSWKREGSQFIIETDFVHVNERTQFRWSFVAFRLFTMTLGRIPTFAYWVKDLLVRTLIRRRRIAPLRLERAISLDDARIVIVDRIERTSSVRVSALRTGSKFATIHMGSARYFENQELSAREEGADWSEQLMREGKVVVMREYSAG